MSGYPDVLDEIQTLEILLEGHGCVRYGDGDFKIIRGQHDQFQAADPALARRLAEGLVEPPPDGLLVCLPRINDLPVASPFHRHWQTFLESDAGIIPFLPDDRGWGSSFISRPDFAPWIHNEEYYDRFSLLWREKDVVLVGSGHRSVTVEWLMNTPYPPRSIMAVHTAARQAWKDYEQTKGAIGRPDLAILSCGPMARVLGNELAQEGVQVLDVGHLGLFFGSGQHARV